MKELAGESSLLEAELVALDGALDEARQRLAAARRRLDDEQEAARLRELRATAEEFRRAGRAASAHLDAFVQELAQMNALAIRVSSASGVRGSLRLEGIRVLVDKSVQKQLFAARLNRKPVDRPSQVRTLADLADHLASGLEGGIDRALDEQAEPESLRDGTARFVAPPEAA